MSLQCEFSTRFDAFLVENRSPEQMTLRLNVSEDLLRCRHWTKYSNELSHLIFAITLMRALVSFYDKEIETKKASNLQSHTANNH